MLLPTMSIARITIIEARFFDTFRRISGYDLLSATRTKHSWPDFSGTTCTETVRFDANLWSRLTCKADMILACKISVMAPI